MAKWALIATVTVVIGLVIWLGGSFSEERTQALPLSLPAAEPSGELTDRLPNSDHLASPANEVPALEPVPLIEEPPAGKLSVLVLDDLGAPVPDVLVSAGSETPPWLGDSGRTGNDGRVRLDCPPARYFVSVNLPPESNGTHGDTHLAGVQVEGTAVEVVAVVARHSAGVRLIVRDGLGAPVVGLLIDARASGASKDKAPRKHTDDQGEVSWSGLAPGRWTFTVKGDPPSLNLLGRNKLRADLVANTMTSAEWTMERRAQVVVDLRSVPTLSELERLRIGRDDRQPPWSPEVTLWVPAGEHTLIPDWAADSSSHSPPLEISVAEAEVLRVPLIAETGSVSLSGRVVDPSGGSVAGVGIVASVYKSIADNSEGNWLATKSVKTDASGMWSLRGLPWGELSVMANCRSVPGRYLDDSVQIRSGTTPASNHIDFGDTTVMPAVRLVCELSDSWQAQLQDNHEVQLELMRLEPPPQWPGRTTRGKTEQVGVYEFEHVVHGDYLVILSNRDRGVLASQALSVPASSGEGRPVHVQVGDEQPRIPTGR